MSNILTDKKFDAFSELSNETIQVLKENGYIYTTPVQCSTIPLLCQNNDVVVEAPTGSGKTLAFILPLYEKLKRLDSDIEKYEVGAIVISPTRELANQTYHVARKFFKLNSKLRLQKAIGGMDNNKIFNKIENKGANVIIATAGILVLVLQNLKMLKFTNFQMLILDEADRLLSLGFQKSLYMILSHIPKHRYTGLFSATLTDSVKTLIKAGLRHPLKVQVSTTTKTNIKDIRNISKTPESLDISYIICEADEKLNNIVEFLKSHSEQKIIIYVLTCAYADFLILILNKIEELQNLEIISLHRNIKQRNRNSRLKSFSIKKSGVLIATDVASRGLDIDDVEWVVQLDAPQDPDVFVHRVGRTARMGKIGHALIYLTPEEESYVNYLEIKKVYMKKMILPKINPENMMNWLRKLAEIDKEVMKKGILAFKSYLGAYSNHKCDYLFRMEELDYSKLAMSFAILRMPKFREIKKCNKENTFVASEVDPRSFLGDEFNYDKKEKSKRKKKKRDTNTSTSTNTWDKNINETNEDYRILKGFKRKKINEHDFDLKLGLNFKA